MSFKQLRLLIWFAAFIVWFMLSLLSWLTILDGLVFEQFKGNGDVMEEKATYNATGLELVSAIGGVYLHIDRKQAFAAICFYHENALMIYIGSAGKLYYEDLSSTVSGPVENNFILPPWELGTYHVRVQKNTFSSIFIKDWCSQAFS